MMVISRPRLARSADVIEGGESRVIELDTPGPAICVAPKPIRLIGLSPRNVVVFISRARR
jgi:hypothetical protein